MKTARINYSAVIAEARHARAEAIGNFAGTAYLAIKRLFVH